MKAFAGNTEEALGPELYRKHLLKVAGVDVDNVMIPPSRLNHLADDLEFAAIVKSFGIDDDETKLNPYNDDSEVDIVKFVNAAAYPDRLDGEEGWGHTVLHSFKCASDLARAKQALKDGNHDEAHRALNSGMRNYLHAHAGICRNSEPAD